MNTFATAPWVDIAIFAGMVLALGAALFLARQLFLDRDQNPAPAEVDAEEPVEESSWGESSDFFRPEEEQKKGGGLMGNIRNILRRDPAEVPPAIESEQEVPIMEKREPAEINMKAEDYRREDPFAELQRKVNESAVTAREHETALDTAVHGDGNPVAEQVLVSEEEKEVKEAAEEKTRLAAEKEAKEKAEAEKKAAEEKARLEAEKEAKEKAEAEKKAAAEKARLEAEKEAKEKAEAEKKAAAEKARLEAEKEAKEKAEAEKKAAAEKARLEAEKEAKEKVEAEKKAAAEKARLEAEKEAKEKAEAEKKAAAEKARLEAEKEAKEKAEAEKKAAAEKARLEAEKEAKEKAEAEKKAAEEKARLESEKKAKVAAENKAAEEEAKRKAEAEAARRRLEEKEAQRKREEEEARKRSEVKNDQVDPVEKMLEERISPTAGADSQWVDTRQKKKSEEDKNGSVSDKLAKLLGISKPPKIEKFNQPLIRPGEERLVDSDGKTGEELFVSDQPGRIDTQSGTQSNKRRHKPRLIPDEVAVLNTDQLHMALINTGSALVYLGLEEGKKNELQIDMMPPPVPEKGLEGPLFVKGSQLTFSMHGLDVENQHYQFKIRFQDEVGVEYYQEIAGRGKEIPFITRPVKA